MIKISEIDKTLTEISRWCVQGYTAYEESSMGHGFDRSMKAFFGTCILCLGEYRMLESNWLAKTISRIHAVKSIASLLYCACSQFLPYSLTSGSIHAAWTTPSSCYLSLLSSPTDSKRAYDARAGAAPQSRRPVTSGFGYAAPAPTQSWGGGMSGGPSYGPQWEASTVSPEDSSGWHWIRCC